ncbi:uncharacterized protein LOC118784294 [Megalops cyprinoides]|uniref:uncharacterized protein LOC118784294 n=1 Tax=Megalops cyprinoides TaxID=118141 RepID=UPI001864B966|nr:uncharacterized protein LOC118784294 [Megalops cyprinoides]
MHTDLSSNRMKKVTAFLLTGVLAMAQCADPDSIPVNVALRGKATQSSTYSYMSRAAKAIDGNRDGVFSRGSCTHTEGETNPWWRLDLMDVYRVTSVTITNRVDFSERINRAEIRIGNSLKNNGNDNPLCTVILTIPPMESMTFNCSGMVGRYINVLLPGYGQFLTLCEVEVYATPAANEDIGPTPSFEPTEPNPFTENVALGKKASQSSTAFLGKADKAIDGNRNTWYREGSCSRTDKEEDPWWRVDLLRVYNITSVTITNREDCCAEMIDGAEIRIGNSLENNGNSNPLCAVIPSFPPWETFTFQCDEMEGRYVNIFLPGCHKYLNLCEVEVNARTAPVSQSSSPPAIQTENPLLELNERDPVKDGHKSSQCSDTMIVHGHAASGKKATQSTQWDDLGDANNAIDRDWNSNYMSGSCSHTKAETDPWWRVDLLKPHNVTSVAVTNREDCCSERINGAEIRIGNSLKNNGNDNPVCAVIPYIPAGQTRTYQCHGIEGRYINIILPGREKYLTLCEVEIYGTAIDDAISILGGEMTLIKGLGSYLSWFMDGTSGGSPEENVALRGIAEQSSQFDGLTHAKNAIDGLRNAAYSSGSCTHTKLQTDPWWRVDLRRKYRVTSVSITNRKDCCHERINGAEIRIGNSLENNGNNNPVCAVVSTIPAGESVTFECNGMEGRYVNVIRLGCYKFLTLCELEVNASPVPVLESTPSSAIEAESDHMEVDPVTYNGGRQRETQCPLTAPENAASGGKATQSSTGWGGHADRAIDRNRNPVYHSRSCTHTAGENDPWWRVDLLKNHRVTSVTVTNRGDCCHDRLNGAEIRIGNSLDNNGNDNPVCAVISHIQEGDSVTFQCNEMEGRYVNVFLPGREKYLTLCEVEVNGSAVPDVLDSGSSPELTSQSLFSAHTGSPEENVALRGIAEQSSQFDGLTHAKNAIDGLRNAAYSSGSCTHTKLQTDPWWRVDLRRKYRVTSVTITNREDCCHERINGAEIRIGNSLENNGNNNPVCAVVSTIPAGESVTFECNGMEGRYVNVIRPGCYKFLTLCELEVNASPVPVLESTPSSAIEAESDHMEVDPVTYNGGRQRETQCPLTAPENAASGGKATQSSTGWGGHADRAIDRNRNPVYHSRSCTHTAGENDPWWRVDLLKNHRVTSVTVTNRGDCCHNRLNGAEIRIGNSLDNNGNDNPVCAVISHIQEGDSVTFQCNEMEGRYVNVFLPGREKYLTLCEVEVNGSAVPDEILPSPSNGFRKPRRRLKNVALRGRATQSSQDSGSAFNAIDGNHNSNYHEGSCTHTELQTDPWWRVDLRRKYRVTSVTITNRGDCCHERINGAEIRIGNSMENNGNNNPVCAVVSSIPAGRNMTVLCKEMEGRYVSIVLPGREKYLTLCEVEVHGVAARSRRKELGRHLIEKLKRGGLDFTVKMPWLRQPKRSKQRS